MTMTPTIWKSKFTVNSTTSGTQQKPQTIGLENGNILVVWEDDTVGPNPGVDIIGQLYNANGETVGGPFQVDSALPNGDETSAKVVALPDGGYVVAYHTTVDPIGDVIVLERFGANGNNVFTNTMTNNGGHIIAGWDVTADAAGNYTLVFQRDGNIFGIRYANATNSAGSEFNAAQNSGDPDHLGAVAAFATGNIVTISDEPDEHTYGVPPLGDTVIQESVEFRMVNPVTGVDVVGPTEVYSDRDNNDSRALDVAVLASQSFVVLYSETPGRISFKLGTGATLGSGVNVASSAAPQSDARVVALDDGGFFIAWADFTNGMLRGKRYDPAAGLIGSTVDIATGIFPTSPLGDLGLTSDGRILVTFRNGDGEISEVILDARETEIHGTSAGEQLTTQTTATSIFGEGGDDTIYGQAGGDTIDGGPGADVLAGGGGNDVYILNDLHRLDPNLNIFVYDSVVEGANKGIDAVHVAHVTGSTVNGYTLGANIENGTITGTDPFGLTGNGVDNQLTGNGADNTLSGLGGNDTIRGNGGNDTINGGAGIDIAVFSGNLSAYTITRLSNSVQVSGPDGTDTLTGINVLKFDDATFAIPAQLASPTNELSSFGLTDGWSSDDRYPRDLADVNGDGFADIVGFAEHGTSVALATGNGSFGPESLVTTAFGRSDGWSSYDRYPRALADVNGDGMADLVGFAEHGTSVALATGNGSFGPETLVTTAFGRSDGWSSYDRYPRALADVNGDGMADLVGFAEHGTSVALAIGNGSFGPETLVTTAFSRTDGWSSNDKYPRTLADVNGDGMADLIGFAEHGTSVALAIGNGSFGPETLVTTAFSRTDGWSSNDRYPRMLADVNADGVADIVGFAEHGVSVALATGNGSFGTETIVLAEFGPSAGGWTSQNLAPRELGDVNGDGAADIIGFGRDGVFQSLWSL